MAVTTMPPPAVSDGVLRPLAEFEEGWRTAGFLPPPALTFPAVYGRRLKGSPNAVAFFEVSVAGLDLCATPHTLGEVHEATLDAAAELVRAGAQLGDRVILCLGKTSNFLPYFLATQALGAIPVPLPGGSDFRGRGAFRERIQAVAADCQPRVIIVDSSQETEAVASLASSDVIVAGTGAPRGPGVEPAIGFRLERSFHEAAFIQYTSGSTGAPKGVVVTHYNLVANIRAITEAAGFGPSDRSFNWLPLYHDMGLVGGFLTGLYLGLETFVIPPSTFVGRPDSWLRGISQFRATFSCAPNFAYNMLARRLPDAAVAGLDLSSWRLAFNGAEPIDRATVDAFMGRFAPVGLSEGTMFPVYGMAEATLAVAFPAPRAAPRYEFIDREAIASARRADPLPEGSSSALCCTSVGRALPSNDVRIREPGGTTELPERCIGEVCVSGPSISAGYFSTLAAAAAPCRELRTGDLGYLAGGDLFIVDRLKDLIIVGGRNVVPSDVERVVAQVPEIRYGSVVAFGAPGPAGTEELFVAAGIEPKASGDAARQAIRRSVFEHFGLSPREILLVKPSAIPKTSSGKVRRAACRELYERGLLTPVADD
jgi:acyl-CoA synthetase (AMP-forming)/AMP-acid ligase II